MDRGLRRRRRPAHYGGNTQQTVIHRGGPTFIAETHKARATRDGNRGPVLVQNRCPVNQFLGIVSMPAKRFRLSVPVIPNASWRHTHAALFWFRTQQTWRRGRSALKLGCISREKTTIWPFATIVKIPFRQREELPPICRNILWFFFYVSWILLQVEYKWALLIFQKAQALTWLFSVWVFCCMAHNDGIWAEKAKHIFFLSRSINVEIYNFLILDALLIRY